MSRPQLFLFCIVTGLVSFNCATVSSKRSVSADPNTNFCDLVRVEHLDSLIIDANQQFKGTAFGGISGVDYDAGRDIWYFISDDKNTNSKSDSLGPSRYYEGSVALKKDGTLDLTLLEMIALMPEKDADTPLVDPEAIRYSAAKRELVWTSEGSRKSGEGPAIFRRHLKTSKTTAVPLPTSLLNNPKKDVGPRHNKSLEGLSIDSDGTLWVGMEAGLFEHGPIPTAESGGNTFFYRLKENGQILEQVEYAMDPIPRQFPGLFADNGVSEILKLPGRSMLVIERSGTQIQTRKFEFSARLYCGSMSAPASQSKVLEKRLLLDLQQHAPAQAANFEGIAFGPVSPEGGRYFLAVSDNNFVEGVPTVLSLYRVTPDPFQ